MRRVTFYHLPSIDSFLPVCVLLDVGTRPTKNSLYELWKCGVLSIATLLLGSYPSQLLWRFLQKPFSRGSLRRVRATRYSNSVLSGQLWVLGSVLMLERHLRSYLQTLWLQLRILRQATPVILRISLIPAWPIHSIRRPISWINLLRLKLFHEHLWSSIANRSGRAYVDSLACSQVHSVHTGIRHCLMGLTAMDLSQSIWGANVYCVEVHRPTGPFLVGGPFFGLFRMLKIKVV